MLADRITNSWQQDDQEVNVRSTSRSLSLYPTTGNKILKANSSAGYDNIHQPKY